jgi:type I restriction enzyme S subunit
MNEWKEVIIDDICEVTSSKRIFYEEYVTTGIPFFRSKEIIELSSKQDVSTDLFIKEEKYNSIKDKFGAPSKDDILLTSVGTLGVPYIVPGTFEFYFKDGNLTWFRKWSNQILPNFFYWWLKSPQGFQSLLDVSIGSTQPALTISGLKAINLNIPPLPEQERIAEALSSLDDKIDLLHRNNNTLEELAETLFRQWFVEEAEDSWEEVKLGGYVNLVSGYSYRSVDLKSSTKALVTLKNFDRTGGFRHDGFKEYTGKYKEDQVVVSGDLIVAHTDITQEAEVLGNPAIVISTDKYETLIISTDLIKVVPTSYLTKVYLYFLMKTDEFKHYCLGASNGTTVLHLSKKALPEYDFKLPSAELVGRFTVIAEPLLEKININQKHIQQLETLRETLLPKLMSGVVRVEN